MLRKNRLYYDVITRIYRNVQQRLIQNVFFFFLAVRSNINLFIKNDYVNVSTYFVVIQNLPKVVLILIPYFNSQGMLNNIGTDKNLRCIVLF